MISLTRLSGSAFLLNADLVERVDQTPDTVITLADGTKYVVTESLAEVRDRVITYRAEIVARGAAFEAAAIDAVRAETVRRTPRPSSHLAAVRDDSGEGDQR